jgi:hypothetical protein
MTGRGVVKDPVAAYGWIYLGTLEASLKAEQLDRRPDARGNCWQRGARPPQNGVHSVSGKRNDAIAAYLPADLIRARAVTKTVDDNPGSPDNR